MCLTMRRFERRGRGYVTTCSYVTAVPQSCSMYMSLAICVIISNKVYIHLSIQFVWFLCGWGNLDMLARIATSSVQ